jgi:DNA-binding transcriptional MerR regulator
MESQGDRNVDREKGGLYTIGQVSRFSGVPVKTIRHYSDEGILPPSGITEAGYRLYSEADRGRLELIRTLRAAGFGLPTVRGLLEEEVSPEEAARIQLEAVELQLKELGRRRALLRSTLTGGEALRSYPERARALALLSAHEREAFLARHLERGMEGIPVDPDWKRWLLRGAVMDLPDELTDEQIEAWTELAELVSDESFIEAIRKQAQPCWESVEGRFDRSEWDATAGEAMREAGAAARDGRSPDGEQEQPIVERYLEAYAKATNRPNDSKLAAWILSHYEATTDPRPERYWELVGILKSWPAKPPQAETVHWLMEGLRWRIDRAQKSSRSHQAKADV